MNLLREAPTMTGIPSERSRRVGQELEIVLARLAEPDAGIDDESL